MDFIETSKLNKHQKEELMKLWNNEYPVVLSHASLRDFEDYFKPLARQNHIIVTDDKSNIKAWYVDFIRNEERWFVIIIDANWQGKKLGSKLLKQAKEKHKKLNGWIIDHLSYKKANEEYYKSPKSFYLKNDFEILQDVTLQTDKISAIKIMWSR